MVPIIEYNYDEYDGYEFYEYEPLEANSRFSSDRLNSETLIRDDTEYFREDNKEFVKKFGSWFPDGPSADDPFGFTDNSIGNVIWLNEAGNGFLGLSELGKSWKKFEEEISFDFDQFETRIERLNIKGMLNNYQNSLSTLKLCFTSDEKRNLCVEKRQSAN